MRVWKGPILVVALALVFGVLGGIAFADDPPNEYTACLGENGQLKDVAIGDEPRKECKGKYVEVSWGEEGPPGPQGVPGPRGERGPKGDPGDPADTEELEAALAVLEGLHCVDSSRLHTLVVSYIDQIDDGGDFDAANDTVITKIIDANLDGGVTVGDCIITNEYPVDPNASATAAFGTTGHVITNVVRANGRSVLVDASSDRFEWWNNHLEELYVEKGAATSRIADRRFPDEPHVRDDEVAVNTASPSSPVASANAVEADRPSDDPFHDIDIYLP